MAKLQILGLSLSTPEPYTSGHICTANEALMLNYALSRGLAKGLYRLLREVSEKRGTLQGSAEDLADCERYMQEYLRGFAQGHERLAAIETEARRIGRARVEAALYRAGRKLADLAKGEQDLAIAREAEKPEVLAEATRRIDLLRSIGRADKDDSLEELISDSQPHEVSP